MKRHALLLIPAAMAAASSAVADDTWARQREKMVREIRDMVYATRLELGKDRLEPQVLAALGRVPRHELVPESVRPRAYLNRPLPIGNGQTISQPYIVAVMTDLLALQPSDRVLEIGTGSGYQAAILAELAEEVFTIEIVPALGRSAERNLKRLGYRQIAVRIGDGNRGWPEEAPFDAIVVTAAGEVPPPLLEQLAAGGTMVIPVGPSDGIQYLTVIQKAADGTLARQRLLPVAFVPLIPSPDASEPGEGRY